MIIDAYFPWGEGRESTADGCVPSKHVAVQVLGRCQETLFSVGAKKRISGCFFVIYKAWL